MSVYFFNSGPESFTRATSPARGRYPPAGEVPSHLEHAGLRVGLRGSGRSSMVSSIDIRGQDLVPVLLCTYVPLHPCTPVPLLSASVPTPTCTQEGEGPPAGVPDSSPGEWRTGRGAAHEATGGHQQLLVSALFTSVLTQQV